MKFVIHFYQKWVVSLHFSVHIQSSLKASVTQNWCGVNPFNTTECSVAVCKKDEEGDKVGSK